jgi:hypothetical protein
MVGAVFRQDLLISRNRGFEVAFRLFLVNGGASASGDCLVWAASSIVLNAAAMKIRFIGSISPCWSSTDSARARVNLR